VRKLGIALVALALFSTGEGTAFATHPRPAGATPVYVWFVPAYRQCVAPNSTHGTPLAFPSCKPPNQASSYLTVGTADSNGAPANSIGHLLLSVKMGTPGPPEDADVMAVLQFKDVRCKPATSASVCPVANANDGPDYIGNIQSTYVTRITDHYNGPGLNEAATMVDIPFPVNANCASTASTSVGGTCDVSTSLNAVVPGAIREDQRMSWELGQTQVVDGGADGNVTTADNTLFAVHGVFVP
jgi:hypothetical protein